MHPFKSLAAGLAMLAALGGGAAAHAATLYTAPTNAGNLDSEVYCQLRNIGSVPMVVGIEGLGFLAKPSLSAGLYNVAPGQAISLAVPNGGPGGVAMSCRFILQGSAKHVRAAAIYWNAALNRYTLAVPAR